MSKIHFAGRFSMICRDRNGVTKWIDSINNMPTTEGLTAILNDFFNAGTQKTSWYIGLINSTSYTALSVSDTLASHSGWLEYTAYSESVRQQFTPLSASGGIIVNDSPSVFTFTAAATLKGMFLASNSTKGGTTGTLWSTALFGSSRTMSIGETLSVYYRLTAAGSAQ